MTGEPPGGDGGDRDDGGDGDGAGIAGHGGDGDNGTGDGDHAGNGTGDGGNGTGDGDNGTGDGDPLTTDPDATRVAIACQGGGSHTAFTAGVLAELLGDWPVGHRLVGLSGTSGGAITAAAAWYGLLADGEDPGDRLRAVWDCIAADDPGDRLANAWTVSGSRVRASGAPVPELSPYRVPGADWGRRLLRRAIEAGIDPSAVPELAGRPGAPHLVVGTVDVNGGAFETFEDGAVTVEALLASAAVPDTFEAVEIDGHWHWDGLFSQNPPINDLFDVPPGEKPEELWVVQINPQTREGEPRSVMEIRDRRNELSGNLSLNQELRFVERVNGWVEAGYLPADRFARTTVRRLELGRALHCSSRVDRDPDFLADLMGRGRERAGELLADLGADR